MRKRCSARHWPPARQLAFVTEQVSESVDRAAALLRSGELVAFPTETVYGLGADASNPVALTKIFSAKGRPADHPLIVHIADVSQLEQWAREISEAAIKLANYFWPGPLTLILKRQPQVNDLVTGGQDTIGLRVPNHPLALQLLQAFGSGIAAPSANRFGRISPTTSQHVRDELGEAVSLILDGGSCAVGIESTIVDMSRGEAVILRPGMISAEQIAHVLGNDAASLDDRHSRESGNQVSAKPRVSGSLESHYAPTTPMRLVAGSVIKAEINRRLSSGQQVAALSHQTLANNPHLRWLQTSNQNEKYAHDLYANLRILDQVGADIILVEMPPKTASWRAINDRLQRAAEK